MSERRWSRLSVDYKILAAVWIGSALLILIIPRRKRRLAFLAFMVKQLITGVLGLVVVESGFLAYPIRELPDVNRTSFAYEYWAYPMVCAIFNVYYPEKRGRWLQFGYYALFTSTLTVGEVMIEKYTDLIRYVCWNWIWSWGSIFLTFLITRIFCLLFFHTLKQKNTAS